MAAWMLRRKRARDKDWQKGRSLASVSAFCVISSCLRVVVNKLFSSAIHIIIIAYHSAHTISLNQTHLQSWAWWLAPVCWL